MNEQFNPLEEAIRERLVRSSSDVPDVATMRERVRVALDTENAARQTSMSSFRSRSIRAAVLVVGLAAGTVAVGTVLTEQAPSSLVVVSGGLTSEPAEAFTNDGAAKRLEPSAVREAVASAQTTDATGAWTIQSQADRVLTLEFVLNGAQPDRSRSYLRIVTPPLPTTAEDVVASITGSLFDTVETDDTVGRIGGLASRSLRLETVEGTTRLAFKVADGTYFETGGINRVFVVHVTGSPFETVVFWVEASPDHIDSLEAAASRFIESLIES